MNLNKFTEKAQEAVLAAPQLASELNHAQVEPEHLLVTLTEQPNGVVPSVLRKLNGRKWSSASFRFGQLVNSTGHADPATPLVAAPSGSPETSQSLAFLQGLPR